MYGYSSYDNYFGLNQQQCMPYMNQMGMSQVRPTSLGTLPGINAPKENKHEVGKALAGIVGVAAAVVLLIKGKGKISTVVNKIFGKKVASEAVEEATTQAAKPGFMSKIKGLFTKKAASVVPTVNPTVAKTERQVAGEKLVDVLHEIQNKVNTPNVDPNATVGKILNVESKVDDVVTAQGKKVTQFVGKKVTPLEVDPSKTIGSNMTEEQKLDFANSLIQGAD